MLSRLRRGEKRLVKFKKGDIVRVKCAWWDWGIGVIFATYPGYTLYQYVIMVGVQDYWFKEDELERVEDVRKKECLA